MGESWLAQRCVLRPGLSQNGDVGIGVFPEGEEILVRSTRFGRVPVERGGASQAEMRQSTEGKIQHDASVINDFLKLRSRCCAVFRP